ncbi:MAG: hypothetical protein HRT35_14265 [Algicola sp.]|nr:hypothetical protein [Algicola sp.]
MFKIKNIAMIVIVAGVSLTIYLKNDAVGQTSANAQAEVAQINESAQAQSIDCENSVYSGNSGADGGDFPPDESFESKYCQAMKNKEAPHTGNGTGSADLPPDTAVKS